MLGTAIRLWFGAGDPVPIHVLAFHAYEVIHVLSKLRGREVGLVFDSRLVREGRRAEVNIAIKTAVNFFKHAKRDQEKEIDFYPEQSTMLMLFAVAGLHDCGVRLELPEYALIAWIAITEPQILSDEGVNFFGDYIPAEVFREHLRSVTKQQFYAVAHTLRHMFTL